MKYLGRGILSEQLIWETKGEYSNDRVIGKIHEYILVYAKNMDSVVLYF